MPKCENGSAQLRVKLKDDLSMLCATEDGLHECHWPSGVESVGDVVACAVVHNK